MDHDQHLIQRYHYQWLVLELKAKTRFDCPWKLVCHNVGDPSMSNADTINRFYTAFANRDPATMAACYDESATFADEVFELTGKREVVGMWTMLLSTPKRPGPDVWKLEFSKVSASGNAGEAHWDAHYRFSATGRFVLNRIDAKFRFNEQGLIVEHRDSFDFWRWSRMALGVPGMLLGWTPFLRNKVRAQARANLDKFLAK